MNRWKLALLSLPPAAVLLGLRIWELKTGFDAAGVPTAGAPATTVLLIACAAAALYWLLLSRGLPPASALSEQAHPAAGLLMLLGGLAIGVSSLWALYLAVRSRAVLGMASGALGAAAGFCLCVDGGLTLVNG